MESEVGKECGGVFLKRG